MSDDAPPKVALPGQPVMLSGKIASLPKMEVWEGVSFCQFTVAYGPRMEWGRPRDGEAEADGFVSCQCLGELAANMANTRIGEQVVILGRFNPRAGIPTPLDALIDVYDLGISLLGSGVYKDNRDGRMGEGRFDEESS